MQPTPSTAPARKLGALATRHPYILGLSHTDTLGTGEAIQASETGIYLDELDDLNLKTVQAAAPNGPLLAMMQASRRDAYFNLETDVMAGLQTLNGPQLGQYVGSVGGTGAYQGVVDVPNGTKLALLLRPRIDRTAVLLIKRIGLLLAADATVSVHVTGEPAPITVVATADTPSYTTLNPPIRIQLGTENCDSVNSYLFFQPVEISYTVAGFMARNNSTSCGCTMMDNRLTEFFTSVIKQPANGILLDIEVGAAETQALLDGYETSPAVTNVVALALRFKAAELLVERIINSNEINRYTTIDQQFLWGKRNEFRKSYQDRINWLISVDGLRTPVNPNTIDSRRPYMGSILL